MIDGTLLNVVTFGCCSVSQYFLLLLDLSVVMLTKQCCSLVFVGVLRILRKAMVVLNYL